MRRSMFREALRWSCIAVPAAAFLVAVAALGFAVLGKGETAFRTADLARAVGFLLVQTLGPIAIWIALTTRWVPLRKRFWLEAILFPFAVALVGWSAVAVFGEANWPESAPVLVVSAFGWLGLSWALLASRATAERLFSVGRGGANES